jgi:hypothetical protein
MHHVGCTVLMYYDERSRKHSIPCRIVGLYDITVCINCGRACSESLLLSVMLSYLLGPIFTTKLQRFKLLHLFCSLSHTERCFRF